MLKRMWMGLVVLVAATLPATAEDWPTRQVTIVSSFPTGGTVDLLARLLAEHLEQKFRHPFVVVDRPGSGGTLAATDVAKARSDGYTILLGSVSSLAISPFVYKRLPFDPERDLVPVTLIVRLPNVLIVHPHVPAETVQELIEYLKANPGRLTYGSAGSGTSQHIAAELFKLRTGTKMAHVPYHSAHEVTQAIRSGKIDIAFNNMVWVWPLVKSGKIRPLAVTSLRRSASAPDVPAISETIKDFDAAAWFGLFVPQGTERQVIDMLAAEVKVILGKPEVIKQLAALGAVPEPMEPEQFGRFVKKEREKWRDLIQQMDIAKMD